MRTPTLSAGNVTLAPLYHATKENVGWLRNPANVQFSEQRHLDHTLVTSQRYIRAFNHTTDHIWCIRRISDNVAVGNISAHRDLANQIADVGILIDQHFWGRGYGTEAWSTVLDYLLHDLRKVEAGTMATNLGMIRIFERSGMVREGERPSHFLVDGNPTSMVYYGKFKPSEGVLEPAGD